MIHDNTRKSHAERVVILNKKAKDTELHIGCQPLQDPLRLFCTNACAGAPQNPPRFRRDFSPPADGSSSSSMRPPLCAIITSMILKRWLVGNPLKTAQAAHQRLSKRLALAVFSSDRPVFGRVCHGGNPPGSRFHPSLAFAHFSIPISLMIILLLAILTLSYSQIIFEYPGGGGAYIVSKSNLGEWPGLTAAASLMIDYVLTVAVSVAAGIAAITSAIPSLFPYRSVVLGVFAIVLVLLVNLRGVRESGKVFAVPTYMFIGSHAPHVGRRNISTPVWTPPPWLPQSMAGSNRGLNRCRCFSCSVPSHQAVRHSPAWKSSRMACRPFAPRNRRTPPSR